MPANADCVVWGGAGGGEVEGEDYAETYETDCYLTMWLLVAALEVDDQFFFIVGSEMKASEYWIESWLVTLVMPVTQAQEHFLKKRQTTIC